MHVRYWFVMLVGASSAAPNVSRMHSACARRPACRKAYRLGKFLQGLDALRRMRLRCSSLALLELVAYAGEGTYYFLDQFLW